MTDDETEGWRAKERAAHIATSMEQLASYAILCQIGKESWMQMAEITFDTFLDIKKQP